MYISIRNIKNYLLKRHIKKFGNKNNGYFNYFVINWSEYKDFVLWLVNHKNYFVRMFGRHKFRINQDREAKGKLIKDIFPNHYDIENPDSSITSVFRTHQKYAKRLYYGFYPVWWTLHFLDWLIQRTVAPKFSFGFDTLTAYPSPSTFTHPCDVGGLNADADWNTCRGGEAGTGYYEYISSSYVSSIYYISRWFFSFNTSSLTSSAILSAANIQLSLYRANENQSGYATIHIVNYNSPGTYMDLATDLFGKSGSTSYANINYNDITDGGYNVFDIGTTLISKTDKTFLSARTASDLNNNAPSAGWNYVSCKDSETSGTSSDPKLVVTYTIPSTFVPQINMI